MKVQVGVWVTRNMKILDGDVEGRAAASLVSAKWVVSARKTWAWWRERAALGQTRLASQVLSQPLHPGLYEGAPPEASARASRECSCFFGTHAPPLTSSRGDASRGPHLWYCWVSALLLQPWLCEP